MRRPSPTLLAFFLLLGSALLPGRADGQAAGNAAPAERPNIVWINIEDMSPHVGAYGETAIETPHIDRLADEGVLFEHAFVTSPVCSPSRSALITGMYQTTVGAHNHRSQGSDGKRGGNEDYYESYEVPEEIKLIPELLREAGYYTTLGGFQGGEGMGELAKADYNFIWDPEVVYSGPDWSGRRVGQPFFAQVQLPGGKNRGAEVADPVDPADVQLPPYYPDTPLMRADWARYLNSVAYADEQVGALLERLEEEGVAENTVVFLFTDHGISHVRGKQYLYDEGLRVPLIVRRPGRPDEAGTRRADLVSHIDIAATSLALAGLDVPAYVQGRSLFAEGYEPRAYVFAARDRMDETVDVARAVRTTRYKYIRNYYTHRAHAQPNRYKDGKDIQQQMRRMYAEGALDSLQASLFEPTRPAEELYDLQADPHETHSLAGDPASQRVLDSLRRLTIRHMQETRDMGLIPEPVLEDLGRRYGSKYAAMQQEAVQAQIPRIRAVIRSGEAGAASPKGLLEAMQDAAPAVRYWAATGLGNREAALPDAAVGALVGATEDSSAAVRVAAALALFKQGQGQKAEALPEGALPVLAQALDSRNLLVQLYAILALEEIGEKARPVLERIDAKRDGEYEFVRRVADRIAQDMTPAAEATPGR